MIQLHCSALFSLVEFQSKSNKSSLYNTAISVHYIYIRDNLLLQDLQREAASCPLVFNLAVAGQYCKDILGNRGENIKRIRQETGANILIEGQYLPESTEKAVKIIGDKSALCDAMSRIVEIISAVSKKIFQNYL